jgi:hypothetical protein
LHDVVKYEILAGYSRQDAANPSTSSGRAGVWKIIFWLIICIGIISGYAQKIKPFTLSLL